jgi:hypothetical protein
MTARWWSWITIASRELAGAREADQTEYEKFEMILFLLTMDQQLDCFVFSGGT